MDKKSLTERDICTKFILSAVKNAGWDDTQIREEVYFTKGRIIVRGKLVSRGKAKKADVVLYYKPNIPLVVIEVKDNNHSVGDGMQQALDYATTLEAPFVFSTNGDGFVFHDRAGAGGATETNLSLESFPSPADLWARCCAWKGLTPEAEQVVLQPGDDARPRLRAAGPDEYVVDGGPDFGGGRGLGDEQQKIYVDGVSATILAERVQYLDENGRLVTESLRDYTRKKLEKHFASLDNFLKRWKGAERKQAIVEELAKEGLPLDQVGQELGKDLDAFDLICHVAFDRKPLTRRERADNVKKRDVFTKYGAQARAVLDALLDKYRDEGVLNLDDPKVLQIPPLDRMGTPMQLIKAFGDLLGFERAVHELQSALYQETA